MTRLELQARRRELAQRYRDASITDAEWDELCRISVLLRMPEERKS